MRIKTNLNIGPVIKNLRKSQGLTLGQLSEESNVALATLSRMETGKMTGTVESHMQIAKVFGLSLSQFYAEVNKFQASQNKPKEEEYCANAFVQNKGASYTILTKDIFSKKMLPMLIELKTGRRTDKEELKIGAEKFIYVLSGKIEVIIGENKKILNKGATLYFDASQTHYIRNIDAKKALYLHVVTPVNL